MLNRITIATAGVGVAAAIAIGAFAATGSHGTRYTGNSKSSTGSTSSTSVIRTATATVDGKSETILTDSRGMPLYYYAPDGAKQSLVTGTLAALWPPVTSTATPTATGLTGSVSVVPDAHGQQVAYNGHLLYTFVSDRRGVVTGQGVENFFVATPTMSALAGSSSSGTSSGTSMYGGY